jgi:DHA2 family multidrug resistance protein-like MFS transporter
MAAAPPARAGAASAISETSFEFGGALGIAVLGSVLTVVYRKIMEGTALPPIPDALREGALETLGGAIVAAHTLTQDAAAQLLIASHQAYIYAFEVTAAVSAGCAVLAAFIAGALLRNVRVPGSGH